MNEETILPLLIQELSAESEIPIQEIHRQSNLEKDLGLSDESLEFMLVSLQDIIPGDFDLSSIHLVEECGTVEGILDAIVDLILS